MKYSYNWLKELSKTKISPEKMVEILMMHSFEVEGIEKKGEGLQNVVVGEIKEIGKHPNADKLQLTKIDVGNKILDIVCGANNIKVGDKVPVALIGAKLPSGSEIKEAEIRGVKSFGMLCAQDELGLGKNHEGILILDSQAKIGEEISKVLDLDDSIFEIKILPDRGHDALSHVGVAREISVLENKNLDYKTKGLKANKATDLKIRIEDENLCPRYIGAVLKNIKVQESPAWMKNRLQSIGVNPINNIVDATNYVMMELGHPLHAFDFNKIRNGKTVNIIVRKAKDKEKIKLLDGTEKELTAEDLVIANDKKALALAGIMGGEDSGISEDTILVVLESANFNATNIRRSRTRLGLKTEASDRYEKGIDPNLCEIAMARVIEIVKSFGGKVEGVVDVYPKPVKPWKIKLDLEYLDKLLGEKIPPKQAIKILRALELKTTGTGKIITVEIPTFRIDLKNQEDLIEEIGRIYGYEKIESKAPIVSIQAAKINDSRKFERIAKEAIAGIGFSEEYNYSFYSSKDAGLSNLSDIKHLELENPMNPEQALLRTSLIPNLLKNIRENLKNFNELSIFEIGHVFLPGKEALPAEKNMLVGALVLEKDKKAESFYELKGYADALFEKLGIVNYYFNNFKCPSDNSPLSLWHSTRCSEIKLDGQEEILGYLGEISPLILKNFGISKRVAMFEFDMEKIRDASKIERDFLPLRKYPLSSRDISMIAPSGIKVESILKNIQQSGGSLILNIKLFDIFDFEEKNETSFAFRIFFGAPDRTLKNEEVDEEMKKISSNLEKDLKMKVRK